MTKKVFDLPTYIKNKIDDWGIETTKGALHLFNYLYDCHGKTKEEIKEMGHFSLALEYENFIEIEEPHKFNIGDEVVCVKDNGTWEQGEVVTIENYDGEGVCGKGYGLKDTLYYLSFKFENDFVKVIK